MRGGTLLRTRGSRRACGRRDPRRLMHGGAPHVVAYHLHLARVHTGANVETQRACAIADPYRSADRASRTVEHGEEPITRRVDLAPAKAVELVADLSVVPTEQLSPRPVAKPYRGLRRRDDVREQQRRDHTIAGLWLRQPRADTGPVDRAPRLLADHPPVVPGGMSKTSSVPPRVRTRRPSRCASGLRGRRRCGAPGSSARRGDARPASGRRAHSARRAGRGSARQTRPLARRSRH